MFCVIYKFSVKPNCEASFLEAWQKLTELIYMNNGSLGSRLHKEVEYSYLEYTRARQIRQQEVILK